MCKGAPGPAFTWILCLPTQVVTRKALKEQGWFPGGEAIGHHTAVQHPVLHIFPPCVDSVFGEDLNTARNKTLLQ